MARSRSRVACIAQCGGRQYPASSGPMLWQTEQGGRITSSHIGARFNFIRDAMGLDPALHPHCLRHAYVIHQFEDGYDHPVHPVIQQQVGYAWGDRKSTRLNSSHNR
jgi:integrase/recombinase XerC